MPAPSVDFDYLETFAAGDMTVVTEVLTLFRQQADAWLAQLETPGDDWRDLVHLIKGSARGIGATALGDVADSAERGDVGMAPQVRAALKDALADIEGYLSRVGGG
ncbi:Hpt domain-containing protein [uncultured Phenylobacterium sp.]|uniref:Hpt domain-containing protein n=1 Tax=uncultured Phenylobacterium sp. TaxID=349273 RepID=UPI0025DE6E37|nr:Hpt domain-containing protein [uncultured Phenylobacterium sp.]